MPHDLDRRRPQHMILLIAKRLTRRDNNRVACVDAEWVKVLHVADGNAVVGSVADDLVLDLFPALHRPLDQQLWRQRERLGCQGVKLRWVVGKA
ncbi:hypothetical protein BC938DRAFT_481032 [Jimgerdemannia flammicorona]|uniref:Uncharacterized protein n=1 Tax=Jimgerdemannia flammicorona TaxID=994334 RepID=A0A433QH18_9FUNG|nr:hypothetical protein BC938DRAFT_481032 [Jimgerdemannia flammicorona]